MSLIAPTEAAPVPGPSQSWLPLAAVAAVALLAGAVFLAYPGIDLAVGRLFYIGEGRFFGRSHRWVEWVRNVFIVFYWACIALALAGLFLTGRSRKGWLGWGLPHWLFLAICLGAGPGLVANLILKDQWGRARPGHVTEFGGKKAFTPPLIPVKECPRNCSFVSGEASSMYIPFFAAAVLMPQSAPVLIAGGTVAGLAAGLVRMAQGGHYLSDVIFAGVFMALTVLITRRLMFGPPILPGLRSRRDERADRAPGAG